MVIFDDRGITLKEVMRLVVNTEGAHSPPVERLMLPKEETDKTRFRVFRDGEVHILGHIMVSGV